MYYNIDSIHLYIELVESIQDVDNLMNGSLKEGKKNDRMTTEVVHMMTEVVHEKLVVIHMTTATMAFRNQMGIEVFRSTMVVVHSQLKVMMVHVMIVGKRVRVLMEVVE